MPSRKLVIVGGVAGGASAARARRLSEEADIVVFERGPHVSFANCGLPYYIGGEIETEEALLLQTPESLLSRFRLDIRVQTEVVQIDRQAREVVVRKRQTGEEYRQPYDALLLAPGAAPIRPPLAGIDRPGIFTLRTVPDAHGLSEWLTEQRAQRAVVVGGGYIGLEMAEQLIHRGLDVTIIEATSQVMSILDPEMASYLHRELVAHGVTLRLDTQVVRFEEADESAKAAYLVLDNGETLPADVVVLGIGVRPEVTLAREAGLTIGPSGGIQVSEYMQTSDPAIWAVGDAVEVHNFVTDEATRIPLAGPANRQGRIAAANMLGRCEQYRGTIGTGILRLFDLTVACTGLSETMARRSAISHHVIHIHSGSHASYYPGASPIHMKLIFGTDGRVLGAQAVGKEGVDKRIDVIATAIHGQMTVSDLAELELAYAPPFGSAKDPVNLAGMAAENVLHGDIAVIQWHELATTAPDSVFLLDVREPDEWEDGVIPGATRIPLGLLRAHLDALPHDREIVTYCRSGQRSYYATRLLTQSGFRCRNLSGAFLTWQAGTKQGPFARI